MASITPKHSTGRPSITHTDKNQASTSSPLTLLTPSLKDLKHRIIAAITGSNPVDQTVLLRCMKPYANRGIMDTIRSHFTNPIQEEDEEMLFTSDEWLVTKRYRGKHKGCYFRQYKHRTSRARFGTSTRHSWAEGSIPKIIGMSNDRVEEVDRTQSLAAIRFITSDIASRSSASTYKKWCVTRMDLAADLDLEQPVRLFAKALRRMSWSGTRKPPRQLSQSQVGGQVTFGRQGRGERKALTIYNKFDEMYLNRNDKADSQRWRHPDHDIPRNRTRCEIQIRGSRMLKHIALLLEPGTDIWIRDGRKANGYRLDLIRLHVAHLICLLDLRCQAHDESALAAREHLILSCHPYLLRFLKRLNERDGLRQAV